MKIMIPLLRRVMPSMIAADIVGVQPMTNIFDTRRRMISSEDRMMFILRWNNVE